MWDYIASWRPPRSPHDLAGVTARRLLGHRAGVGLHRYPGFPPERALPTLRASLDGDTAGAGRVELVAEPGSVERYWSGSYTILQLLVEEVTGEPFAAFMRRRVLAPLGMTRSTFEPAPAAAATGHGFRSVLVAAPDRGDGLVVLANSDRSQAMTSDLRCGWGSATAGRELASCWVERKRRGTLLLVAAMVGLGVLMDGGAFLLRRLRRQSHASVAPSSAPTSFERRAWYAPRPERGRGKHHARSEWARLGLSVALLAGWWLFWYTDELSARPEGIANFVPASALSPTFFWLTLVFTAWCLLGVARWAFAMRASRAPAEG